MATTFSLPGVDLNNATSIAIYYQTHAIPQRYSAAIIIASVAVAILGSYATLFVLGKRTGNSGMSNITLLILAATTMSFVGIWGMHFIGMHMRLEAVPGLNWYIDFNAGFTVFSLVVPLIALLLSFLIVDQATVGFRLWKVVVAGTLLGGTIALMHYSASFFCSFKVNFAPAQTVISILLACVLSTVSLTAFFRFRSQWQDSWWKRGLCAIILGCGVAGMHYIGSSGTSYRVKAEFDINELAEGKRRNDVLIIIIGVTCFVVVLGSSFTAFSDFFVVRETRKKARKLVVASATFDRSGRLMVHSDGTLPLITVEERTLRHSEVLDALDQRSSVFQWLYAVSWDWEMIMPYIESIASRLFELEKQEQRADQRDTLTRSQKARRVLSGRYTMAHQDVLQHASAAPLVEFRDKVIDAARRLANELDIPLPDVGVFYDHVLPTGTRRAAEVAAAREAYRRRLDPNFATTANHTTDEEHSIGSRAASIFGEGIEEEEGVTIFVVREVPTDQVSQLAKKGYRFTETRFLSAVLADRHAVIREEMESLLESLRVYAKRGTKPVVQPGGVYVGLFGVRPNPYHRSGGLDVLVYNFARHQIPAYRLPDVAALGVDVENFLRMVDQMTMEDVMKACEVGSIRSMERQKTVKNYLSMKGVAREEVELSQLREEVQALDAMVQFQQALYIALEALHQSVRFFPRILSTARVSAEVLEVPSSLVEDTAPAQIILVQAVLPVDKTPGRRNSANTAGNNGNIVSPSDKPSSETPFVFSPYTLFAKSQMMMLRGQSAEEFEQEVLVDLERKHGTRDVQGEKPGLKQVHTTMSEEDVKMSEIMSEKSLGSKKSSYLFNKDNRSANNNNHDSNLAQPSKTIRYLTRLSAAATRPITPKRNSIITARTDSPTLPPGKASVELQSRINEPGTPKDALLIPASQSLGIRRFTVAGREAESMNFVDQTRFARSQEDVNGEEDEDNDDYEQEEEGEDQEEGEEEEGECQEGKEERDEEEKESQGGGQMNNDVHSPVSNSTDGHPLGSPSVNAPRRTTSKTTILNSSRTVNFSTPNKRPSTAAQTDHRGPHASPMQSRRPRTADIIRRPSTAQTNFDNWQSRQLDQLEKHQPNLLLGILPSEY